MTAIAGAPALDQSWERMVAARLGAGDPAAFSECYRQLGSYVYGLAVRVLRDNDLAQDVTQEVFCQLWERPRSFDPDRGSLRSFLGVLAHRRSVDLIRRAEASKRREQAEGDTGRGTSTPDIAEDVQAGMAAEYVRRAVDQLPEDQRRPIVLAYFGGKTFREVAEILEIPEGTAKSRIRMALTKLGREAGATGVTA